jgi:TonB family protein
VSACEEVEAAPGDTHVLSPKEMAALGDRIKAPRRLSGPDPVFSVAALSHGGTVIVACRVMVNGCVVGCRVVQSVPDMDGPVLHSLQRRRYEPATLDGKPVNIEYTFRVSLREARN